MFFFLEINPFVGGGECLLVSMKNMNIDDF